MDTCSFITLDGGAQCSKRRFDELTSHFLPPLRSPISSQALLSQGGFSSAKGQHIVQACALQKIRKHRLNSRNVKVVQMVCASYYLPLIHYLMNWYLSFTVVFHFQRIRHDHSENQASGSCISSTSEYLPRSNAGPSGPTAS